MNTNKSLPYQRASEDAILQLKTALYAAEICRFNQSKLLGRKQYNVVSQCFHIRNCIIIFD